MGVVWGVIQAAAPLDFWWLDPATVYALLLALIAAVYIGFAVADGRRRGRRRRGGVAAVFVIVQVLADAALIQASMSYRRHTLPSINSP